MKHMNSVNETAEANIKLNEKMQDGTIQDLKSGGSEAEKANLQIQERFDGEGEGASKGITRAYLYNNQ